VRTPAYAIMYFSLLSPSKLCLTGLLVSSLVCKEFESHHFILTSKKLKEQYEQPYTHKFVNLEEIPLGRSVKFLLYIVGFDLLIFC